MPIIKEVQCFMNCYGEINEGCERNTLNRCCRQVIICILAALFLFVAGAVLGAYIAEFIVANIVAISIFAIVLLLALVISVIGFTCRRRN